MKTKDDVLIIGAGLAGLCCALRLQNEGVSYKLLEGSSSIGGRIKTDEVDGFLLDRGFQILLSAYPEAREILDYDLLELKAFLPGARVRHDGKFHELTDPWRRPDKALQTMLSPVGTISDKFKMLLLHQGLRASEGVEASNPTTMEALRRFGFSESMITEFFRPFFSGIFLEPDLDTHVRMFDFVFKMLSAGDNVLPAQGMQAIPNQIASKLNAENIKLHHNVAGIDGSTVLLSTGESITGRVVVIATDEPHARKLLRKEPAQLFRSQTCIYLSADKAPTDDPILFLNGEMDGMVNNFCVPSNVCPSYAPPGKALLSASVVGIPDMSETMLLKSVLEQLHGWFGEQVSDWNYLRSYRIKYALPDQSPAMVAKQDELFKSKFPIYLCGDYCETGSINGAMVSGRKTAEAVLAALKMECSAV